ncbi:MAG: hypothetical protein ACPL3E_01850, partial [Minisyncoccia bacterium]
MKFLSNQNILKINKTIFLTILIGGIFFGFNFVLAQNFIGPSCAAGQCQGKIGVDANGNISIGTSTPQTNTKTYIIGSTFDSSAYALRILSSNSSPLLLVRNDGRVSIATTSVTIAGSGLTVQGDIFASGNITGGGNISSALSAGNVTPGVFNSLQGSGTGAYAFLGSLGVATTTQVGLPQTLSVYGGGYFSGNVGIGTTAPGQKLDVSGNIRASGETIGTLGSGYGQFRAIAGNYGAFIRNDGTDTYIPLLTASLDQYGSWNTLRPLRVNNASGDVYLASSQVYIRHSDGNVGIGTTGPGAKLEVTDSGDTTIRIKPASGANNRVSNYDFWGTFYNYPADTVARRVANIQAGFSTGVWGTEYMAFGLGSNDAAVLPTERMRITGSGNVGIGTTTPAYKLDVAGQIRSSSGGFVFPDGTTQVTAAQALSPRFQ